MNENQNHHTKTEKLLLEAARTFNDTIDYEEVFNLIKNEVENTAYSLLERLASSLAGKLLDTFPVYRVTLRVRKLTPPIAGNINYIEVEITRYQADVSKLLNESDKEK